MLGSFCPTTTMTTTTKTATCQDVCISLTIGGKVVRGKSINYLNVHEQGRKT